MEDFHWTVCVSHGKPGPHFRMGREVIHLEDVDTEVKTEDSLRKRTEVKTQI